MMPTRTKQNSRVEHFVSEKCLIIIKVSLRSLYSNVQFLLKIKDLIDTGFKKVPVMKNTLKDLALLAPI